MARFLADAGMEKAPDDVRGMWLSCQADCFRRDVGRTLPERPRLVQLMGSALAEWPGMETEGRPMYGNGAYGCHRQVLGLLDGTTDPESQRILARWTAHDPR